MLVKNLEILQAFLERDIQDYSDERQRARGRDRNAEIIQKIQGKENGSLFVYIYSNLGLTMASLQLEMGHPADYKRVIHLGSNPHEYKITKVIKTYA